MALDEKARLTIKEVNNGRDFIVDERAAEIYGLIFASQVWNDVQEPDILLEKAWDHLTQNKLLSITLELSALDLHLLNLDISALRVGDSVRVISEPHNLDEVMMIRKISIDLSRPEGTVITLGSSRTSLIDTTTQNIADSADSIRHNTEANYATGRDVSEMVEATAAQMASSIDQTAERLLLAVAYDYVTKSNLRETEERLDASLALSAADMMLRFYELQAYAENVEGALNHYMRETQTYIRFDINGIEIGRIDSPFMLKLSNSEMGIYQNGQKVAYFNDNRIYITNGEILTQLTIGNFGFIPEDSGALSITKIK